MRFFVFATNPHELIDSSVPRLSRHDVTCLIAHVKSPLLVISVVTWQDWNHLNMLYQSFAKLTGLRSNSTAQDGPTLDTAENALAS